MRAELSWLPHAGTHPSRTLPWPQKLRFICQHVCDICCVVTTSRDQGALQ